MMPPPTTQALSAKVIAVEPVDLRRLFVRAASRSSAFYRRGPDGGELLGLGVACAGSTAGAGLQEHMERLVGRLTPAARRHVRLMGWTAFDRDYPDQDAAEELPGWQAFSRSALFCPQLTLERKPGADVIQAVIAAPEVDLAATWHRWKRDPRRATGRQRGVARLL